METSEIQAGSLAGLPQAHQFTKAQTRVGSIRNGQINYLRDQTCFGRWDEEADENKQQVKEIRNQVRNEIDLDFLGTKKPAWNASVGIVGHPKEEHLSKNLFDIKKGLQDEKITKLKEQKVYTGIDTRDAYHTGWNSSTELVHARDSQRFIDAT